MEHRAYRELDRLRIRAIRDMKEDYELVLPADTSGNLHFVVAERKRYSRLFEGIYWCLARGEDARVGVEFDGKKRCDPRLIMVEENLDYRNLLDYFVEMKYTDDFARIARRANRTFSRIISGYSDDEYDEFLRLEGRDIMIPGYLTPTEATVAYHSLLAAIRKMYRIDTPLVVEGFGRYGLRYAPLVAQLISETAPQALIFMTGTNFAKQTRSPVSGERDRSVYDSVNGGTMASAHRLRGRKMSRYVPKR